MDELLRGGCKDFNNNAELRKFVWKMKAAEKGDIVSFGRYEQGNGVVPVEWQVLEQTGEKVLLISRYGLDCVKYHEDFAGTTWDTCSLRKWLNEDFLNCAFTDAERNCIKQVNVSADKNPTYDTSPGNDANDKVFLLSVSEAEKYFENGDARAAQPTLYAKSRRVFTDDKTGNCWWWLRSPGFRSRLAALVYFDGSVNHFGDSVISDKNCVRPALWINLDF